MSRARTRAAWTTVVVAIATATVWVLAHDVPGTVPVLPPTTSAASSSSAAEAPAAAATSPSAVVGDYYTVDGAAQRLYTPARVGDVEYCPVDELHRPVCAYGELTTTLRTAADGRPREPLTINPPGWGHNAIVTIPAAPNVLGSKAYHGYFWNRSHLVADSLGGDAIAANLITGTRTQNVGSTQRDGQYAGGMAHTEKIARDYLHTHDGDSCPLYYAATAHYTGIDLIPRTVTVDIQSCDRAIDEQVEVTNTAMGWSINYASGTFVPTS